jgi:hypothetical protein
MGKWNKEEAKKFGKIGFIKLIEKNPNALSEMGKKSRQYENEAINVIKNKFDHIFLPNEVCDRIAMKNDKIFFIEIKRNERHSKLTEKQTLFKELIKDIENVSYRLYLR